MTFKKTRMASGCETNKISPSQPIYVKQKTQKSRRAAYKHNDLNEIVITDVLSIINVKHSEKSYYKTSMGQIKLYISLLYTVILKVYPINDF